MLADRFCVRVLGLILFCNAAGMMVMPEEGDSTVSRHRADTLDDSRYGEIVDQLRSSMDRHGQHHEILAD
jgi:hypothetical protein